MDAALALRSHIKDVVLRRYQHVKRVNSELASAYKEMETFSYTVSHDLRAPLRGINGFAEILLEDYADKLDENARGMLKRIQSSTTKMNLFIDDLLQLAKLGVSAPNLKQGGPRRDGARELRGYLRGVPQAQDRLQGSRQHADGHGRQATDEHRAQQLDQ